MLAYGGRNEECSLGPELNGKQHHSILQALKPLELVLGVLAQFSPHSLVGNKCVCGLSGGQQ